MARFAEAELAVELMGVPREEDPAPEALEVGMRLDGRHELLAHAAAPMGIEHEDIAATRARLAYFKHRRVDLYGTPSF